MSHPTHHGMSELEGIHAFCEYGHEGADEDRFGRIFSSLSPLYVEPNKLRELGKQGGPMDGGDEFERTDSVTVGQIFFGQFIDHDITLDVTTSLSGVFEAGEVPNVRTPTLDLDNIYGMGPEASPFLYQASPPTEPSDPLDGVKILTGEDGTAVDQDPHLAKKDLARSANGTAIIGDHRNDENRVLSQLELAMIRFHNQVAQDLHDARDLEHGELFEEARRLVRWHYQYIVVEDYLPDVCGQAVVDRIKGKGRRYYCPATETPYIPIEFAVAAYRYGHSMMPQTVHIQEDGATYDLFGPTLGLGFSPLDDEDAEVEWSELVETDEDRNVQLAERCDTQLATDLLELPFIREGEKSLATRNLLRGQAFLLPSGEQVAHAMGRDEDEIEQVADYARDVAEPDVDLNAGIPLWFYILAEAEELGREASPGHFESGEGLGPVGARIVAETLYGIIELDDRSYLKNNRNWDPRNTEVGVTTLGEMLTYGQ